MLRSSILVLLVLSACSSGPSCTERMNARLLEQHARVYAVGVRATCDERVAVALDEVGPGVFCACRAGLYDDETMRIFLVPGGTTSMSEEDLLDHEAGHAHFERILVPAERFAWELEYRYRKARVEAGQSEWPSTHASSSKEEFYAEMYRLGQTSR